MHDFKYENNMENLINHNPHALFIIINGSSSVFILWKWGETSSTTSLLLYRPSSN